MHGPALFVAWDEQTALSSQVDLLAQGWQRQWGRGSIAPEVGESARAHSWQQGALPLGHSCGLAARRVILGTWLFGG